jgi:2-desacetyl-2-hydroxyethyl bacteriochlorophyllide A dehydrogenase
MNGRRVVWPEAKHAELSEFEVLSPGKNEVLIETEYTVVSAGTEKAWLAGMPNTSNTFPQYPGYSANGKILEVGPEVEEFSIGDRVVAYHSPHSSHAVKNVRDLVKIEDDSIRSEEAAFMIIACMSLHGIRKAKIEIGESAVIIGQGLLGLFATQLARIAGAYPVIALDFSDSRRELATELGADYAMSPADSNFKDTFNSVTAGKGANAIIEVTGAPEAMNLSMECVARAGRIVALGCTRNKVDGVDFYRDIHHPGVSIIGAHNMVRPRHDTTPGSWTMRDDMRVLLNLVSGSRLIVSPMISQIVKPEKAPEVYKNLLEIKDAPLGVVFNWNS